MKKRFLITPLLILVLIGVKSWGEELRWWKGTTHTHSWWSAGDNPPATFYHLQ